MKKYSIKRLTILVFLTFVGSISFANEISRYVSVEEALKTRGNLWNKTEGDLNADGINDVAIIVTGYYREGETAGRGEKLIILTGNADGSSSLLSTTNEFCNVRYHYNLTIRKGSLFVAGITSISANMSNYTLQFRYNKQLNDLELIGREKFNENYDKQTFYRISVNYLTQRVIHSRKAKNRYKEASAKMNKHRLHRLNGFDCDTYTDGEPMLYINDDFIVERPE